MNQEIKELNTIIEQSDPNPDKIVTKFEQYWPIIRMALRLAKVFTGPKGDIKINEIIEWGNNQE